MRPPGGSQGSGRPPRVPTARPAQLGGLPRPQELASGCPEDEGFFSLAPLRSTPIINPPQSAILGMHGIFPRPVAVKGQVVIRPMMYIALTYDHRLIDGREAVTTLKRIKELCEDPNRFLLGC